MKKRLKRMSFVLILVIFLISSTILTSAAAPFYNTYNNHVLLYGVGNYGYGTRAFYITSGANEYSSSIYAAMDEWTYTTTYWGITTPISFVQTSVQSTSIMDINKTYVTNNINGWTYWLVGGSAVNPYAQNWNWGDIYLNRACLQFKTSTQVKAVVAHEMGHVFGLNDNNTNTYSIMCETLYGRLVNRAQPCDLDGINYLY